MMKIRRLVGSVVLGVLVLAQAMRAEDAVEKPGLVVTYYGNPTFVCVGGSFETNSLNFQKDLNLLPWPAWNYEPTNGPLFNRNQNGWSAMLAGQLKIAKAGPYAFAQNGDPSELWVNNRRVVSDGKTTVILPAGTVPLKCFVKSTAPLKDWMMKVHLTWRGPGPGSVGDTMGGTAATPSISSSVAVGVPDSPDTKAFREIDPSLITHTQADVDQKHAFRFDFPLEKGITPLYNYREYTIDAPEDGCYEFIAQFDQIPVNTILWLDGKQIFYLQSCAGVTNYGLEFRNNARVVRYLTKGRHVVRLHMNVWCWWVDNIDRLTCRFGVSRVVSTDPEQTRSIVIKDRDDMVFRKGEPLTIRVEQATDAPVKYEAQVRRQRGGKQALWTGQVALKGGAQRTAGELVYPCDQAEGGFEVTVTDEAGQVVAGPWAFVVVDTTPVQLPTADKGYVEQKVLVDSVDCLLTNDPEHKFRDNGTSRVIESTVGKCRVTGERGLSATVGYIQDKDKTWRKVKPGEQATANFTGLDWFAYTLKVKNPVRPHMVVVEFPNDIRRLISVFAFDPVTGLPSTGLIESGDAPASAPFGQGRFMAWPNTNTLDVIAINNGNWGTTLNCQTAVRRIELYELPEGIPVNPAPVAGWNSGKEFGWTGEQIEVGMEQLTMPKVWEGDGMVPGNGAPWPIGYYDWEALFTVWNRCGQYAANRGANLLCWPVYAYGRSMIQNVPRMPKLLDAYSASSGRRLVDPFEREQFKMMLLLCEKYRLRFVLDFMMQRLYVDQILATDKEKKYDKEGIFINDRDCFYLPNPAHPLVKQYMVDMMGEIGKQYGKYQAFAGVYTRQWGAGIPQNLDCWYASDLLGYDDFSIKTFEQETGAKIPVAETGPSTALGASEKKKEMRRDWILANIKEQWLTWRCQKCLALREAMTAEIQKYAPQARMYSAAPPSRAAGLDPEKVKGRRDLGFGNRANFINPNAHIEINRLDPVEFANFDVREPASLRRSLTNLLPDSACYAAYSADTSREYPYGFYAADNAIRVHPYQLKEPAEALAAGQMETIFYSGTWMLPPMDEGLRKFAQVWRAIPDLKYQRLGDDGTCGGLDFSTEYNKISSVIKGPLADQMAICWQASNDSGVWPFKKHETVFYLVNRTAYPQTVDLTFDGKVTAVRDLVTGKAEPMAGAKGTGRTAARLQGETEGCAPQDGPHSGPTTEEGTRVTVDAYMPAVFSAKGGSVRKMEIVTAPQEVAELERQVQHLRAMAPQAKDYAQILRGQGEIYVKVRYGIDSWAIEANDKEWGRRDLKIAFASLLDPIEAAWQRKNYAKVRDLLDIFLINHNWWYQALGWPEGQYFCLIPNGAYATPKDLFPAMKADDLALVKMDGLPYGEAVQVPKGKATFTPLIATAGQYEMRVWLLSGEEAGPVDVAVNGKPAGTLAASPSTTLGTGGGKPRLVHCVLPQPIGLLIGPQAITLESRKALTISAIELAALPPTPIKVWSIVGAFDTGYPDFDGFSKVSFPPEKGIDLAAEYDGIDGKKIKWQQIDIGEDKFIQLLEKYFSRRYNKGNKCLGYLATWVYSPDERDVSLYYASDWFLQVWVNGAEVIHYAAGPWYIFDTKTVHLKAGWNVLLAKSGHGNNWKAVFALSDPGDLKYSATPVQK